jgi:hypothetical protein
MIFYNQFHFINFQLQLNALETLEVIVKLQSCLYHLNLKSFLLI